MIAMSEGLQRYEAFISMVAEDRHADDCGGLFEEPHGCWGRLARAALDEKERDR
jgi:hypothetical protein